MFTGIVEELGQVVALEHRPGSAVLTVLGPTVSSDATHGASVAVNGVCLTVVEPQAETLRFDVMAETLHHSSLGALAVGDPVNLERAMAATGRLGGHIVQGHTDGIAHLLQRTPGDHSEVVRFTLPAAVARYVVQKGSITVDGVSLTVSEVADEFFEVSLIPTTLALTTLGRKNVGDAVNLEVDVVAKYVERLLPSWAGHRDHGAA